MGLSVTPAECSLASRERECAVGSLRSHVVEVEGRTVGFDGGLVEDDGDEMRNHDTTGKGGESEKRNNWVKPWLSRIMEKWN